MSVRISLYRVKGKQCTEIPHKIWNSLDNGGAKDFRNWLASYNPQTHNPPGTDPDPWHEDQRLELYRPVNISEWRMALKETSMTFHWSLMLGILEANPDIYFHMGQ